MDHRIGRTLSSLAVCAALAGAPAAALAWAAGTHAYIAKRTNKMGGLVTDAEMCRRVFGANGPDLFNAIWEDQAQLLAYVLHTRDAAPNVSPYWAADGALQRAYGFGFASHNNEWGTDATAHFAGRTFGKDEGYVIAKAAILGDALAPQIGQALSLPPQIAVPMAREVSHNFVEYAVDFLLAQADPELPWTLYASAGCYAGKADDEFLYDALGLYFAAALSPADPAAALPLAKDWIEKAEGPFVAGLGANGYLLSLPYEQAKPVLALQTAFAAQKYLAWRFPGLFNPMPTVAQLEPLVEQGLDGAMALCAPDFMDEIEATIGRVNGQMSSRGIVP